MKPNKREVEILVLSDLHLGTYGCKAEQLLNYLNGIEPKQLILNGDIIDIWRFKKNYWPKSHMKVIKYFTSLLSKGIPIYYITGNHDEMMRKFTGLCMGNLHIKNQLVLELNGDKAWFFHGDAFDVSMQHAKWIAKLGALGYDLLILLNWVVNFFWEHILGQKKVSLSKKIKDSVKKAVKYLNDFEVTAAEMALANQYDYVVCGHVHRPEIKSIFTERGEVNYLNSGDWVENMTALEYNDKKWSLYNHNEAACANTDAKEEDIKIPDSQEIFNNLLKELTFVA